MTAAKSEDHDVEAQKCRQPIHPESKTPAALVLFNAVSLPRDD
jgi:hypothetical protein